ncbi:MAG: Serine/threonine-protein kinase pkn1 [Nitrospira sp.]|nr:Serine/threonine-protein kinase pkn1 [Nitrospira sp.]
MEHQHTLFGNGDYQKALRFGTAELKRRLEGFEADIQMRYWRHRLLTVFHQRDIQLRKAERERQRLAAEVRAAEDKARVEALLKAEAKERQLRKAERQLRKEERWVRVECRSQVQERDEISVKKVPTGEVDRVEVTEQETYWEEEVRPGGWFRKEVRTQVQKTRPKVVVKEVPRMKEVRRTIRRKGPEVMEWSFIDGLGNQIPRGKAYNGYDIPIVFIVPGSLIMGSPSDEPDRQSSEVQHIVTLTHPFALAQTPCTQAQWEVVMGGNPSMFKGAKRPVETVSWDEALEYCRKLTTKHRAKGILPEGWEWRLPTEAEWEYAARAGTTGPRYGELNAIGWWDGNSGGQTHPVKQKAANAWGLYDMVGNVWEWCSDWSADYPTGSVTDPKGSSSGSYRVFRGGSWNDGAKGIRSAIRFWLAPGHRDSDLGFRPALSSVR